MFIFSLLFLTGYGQKQKKDFSFSDVAASVSIDGVLDEWNALNPIGEDSIWMFSASRDDENMYFAVVVRNELLRMEAARNGILIDINTQGKKKEGMSLTFPIPDSETIRAMRSEENLTTSALPSELIKRSRGYLVKGFPTIVDGLLSFKNTYGIAATAKIADDQTLVYEAVIPLALLDLRGKSSKVAIKVAINNRYSQMQKMYARANQNSPYRMMGAPRASVKMPFKGSVEAWVIEEL